MIRKILLAMVFYSFAPAAFAATYYVDGVNGLDSRTCMQAQTSGTPKKSLNNTGGVAGVISCMSAGDTLFVRAGTYTDWVYLGTNPFDPSVHPPVPSGMDNMHRTIVQGFPGDARPVIKVTSTNCGDQDLFGYQVSNFTWDGIDLNADGLATTGICNGTVGTTFVFNYNGGSNFTFQNSDVYSSPENGVQVGDANAALANVNFNHMKVHDIGKNLQPVGQPGPHAMYTGADSFISSGVVFDNLEIYNCNDTSGNNNAEIFIIYHLGGSNNNTQDFTLRNSYFHNNSNQAILVGSGTNLKVYNNIITTSGTNQAEAATAISIGYNSVSNAQIYNNTIYNNAASKYAIGLAAFTQSATNISVKNNILWMNGNSDAIDPNLTGTTGYSGTPNLLATDPAFVNAAGNNFHITSGSMARNVGVNISNLFTTDKDGVTRPSVGNWDDGAYQFAAVVTTSCANTALGNNITCIVSKSAASSDTKNVTITGVNGTGGKFIEAIVAQASGTPCTMSSTPSNTWVPGPVNSPADTLQLESFRAYNATVSSSMTFSCLSTNVLFSAMAVGVYSGVATAADPFDQSAQAATPGVSGFTSLTVGPATPTNNNQLLSVGVLERLNSTFTASNGFTVFENVPYGSGVNFGVGMAMKTLGAPAATSTTLTPDVSWGATATLNTYKTTVAINMNSFTQQPTQTVIGTNFNPPVAGHLSSGNADSLTILVSIGGCVLAGIPTTFNASTGGNWSWGGSVIGPPGVCTLEIIDNSDSTVAAIFSTPFNMVSMLTFTVQPVQATNGVAMTSFTVSNSYPQFNGTITLQPNGCGVSWANLTATGQPNAVFTMVTPTGTGINCMFFASANLAQGVFSNPFVVVNQPPTPSHRSGHIFR